MGGRPVRGGVNKSRPRGQEEGRREGEREREEYMKRMRGSREGKMDRVRTRKREKGNEGWWSEGGRNKWSGAREDNVK